MMTTTEQTRLVLNNNQDIKHQGFSHLPAPYFLIHNKQVTSSFNYEIVLPVVFIVLFLLILLIIYLANTYCFNSVDKSELPRSAIYSRQMDAMNIQSLRNDPNRRSTASGSYRYCEEPRTGFYHIQKASNQTGPGRACTFNHNYDKIYDSHPSNLILAIQHRNLINQSENSTGYELPSIEEALPLCNQVETRALNFYEGVPSGQYILDASSTNNNMNFILKAQTRLSASAQKDMENGLYKELSVLRRSYSNSRLNYERWQRSMSQQHPANNNQNQAWNSKIMSEHQMATFLAKKRATHRQGKANSNNISKLQSFQMLRHQGGLMSRDSRFEMVQSLRDESLDAKLSKQPPTAHSLVMRSEEKTCNSDSTSSSTIPITKSYSGILASNREYSSYFENQENTLNKSELNLNRNMSHSDSDPNQRKKKTKASHRKSSSYIQSRQYQSSNFKTSDKTEMRPETHVARESNLINKLNNKIREKKVRGSRLCKSFTFLSERVVEETQGRDSIRRINFRTSPHSRKAASVFISEPNKLSMWPESLKTQQSNYLKNLNAFKLKSGYLSSNMNIYETVKSVSSLVVARKKGVSDAAVQTSIISEGSSFNSQVTTLMQTNNYGSIIGNFGSASIHQNVVNSKGMRRLRAYSEGNFLSDSVSSDESAGAYARVNQSIVLLPHSASFSKIMYSKVETFI